MKLCPRCGSADTKPYAYKPPAPPSRGGHSCTPACVKAGTLCLGCRVVT